MRCIEMIKDKEIEKKDKVTMHMVRKPFQRTFLWIQKTGSFHYINAEIDAPGSSKLSTLKMTK